MRPVDEFFPEPRMDGSKFKLTVAKDAPPGIYEVRAAGYFGLSTARPFVVAPIDSNEVIESGDHSTRDKAMAIEGNSLVTGSVGSRGIDWYRFHANSGQRLLIEIRAERIDSRMDVLIVLYDESGREVGRNREHFQRDPFLEWSSEQDGTFYLAVSDILYRGSGDHFYRLSVSDRPHIDFIDPPAGEPGTKQRYTLYGRNLPDSTMSGVKARDGKPLESVQVEIELPNETDTPAEYHPGERRQGMMPGFDYRIGNSNVVRIGFATARVIAENSKLHLQNVTVPAEIAGRFDEANDEDLFRFHAEQGKTYCVEAIADRMGSKVDPYLVIHRITNAADGQETRTQVVDNDDMPSFFSVDGKNSINVDTYDAAVTFTAEDDGEYTVTIVNQFGGGSAVNLYRLAIREPTYDFQLLATTEHPLPTNRTGFSVTPHLRQVRNASTQQTLLRNHAWDHDRYLMACR